VVAGVVVAVVVVVVVVEAGVVVVVLVVVGVVVVVVVDVEVVVVLVVLDVVLDVLGLGIVVVAMPVWQSCSASAPTVLAPALRLPRIVPSTVGGRLAMSLPSVTTALDAASHCRAATAEETAFRSPCNVFD
jgi:hypothetical protein